MNNPSITWFAVSLSRLSKYKYFYTSDGCKKSYKYKKKPNELLYRVIMYFLPALVDGEWYFLDQELSAFVQASDSCAGSLKFQFHLQLQYAVYNKWIGVSIWLWQAGKKKKKKKEKHNSRKIREIQIYVITQI